MATLIFIGEFDFMHKKNKKLIDNHYGDDGMSNDLQTDLIKLNPIYKECKVLSSLNCPHRRHLVTKVFADNSIKRLNEHKIPHSIQR